MPDKILALALIVTGEILTIIVEIISAKKSKEAFDIADFLILFCIISLAGCFLLLGYRMGYHSFRNVWVVVVLSITAIIVIEPVIAYLLCKELPTKGALIGFAMGAIGMLCTLCVK